MCCLYMDITARPQLWLLMSIKRTLRRSSTQKIRACITLASLHASAIFHNTQPTNVVLQYTCLLRRISRRNLRSSVPDLPKICKTSSIPMTRQVKHTSKHSTQHEPPWTLPIVPTLPTRTTTSIGAFRIAHTDFGWNGQSYCGGIRSRTMKYGKESRQQWIQAFLHPLLVAQH